MITINFSFILVSSSSFVTHLTHTHTHTHLFHLFQMYIIVCYYFHAIHDKKNNYNICLFHITVKEWYHFWSLISIALLLRLLFQLPLYQPPNPLHPHFYVSLALSFQLYIISFFYTYSVLYLFCWKLWQL